MTRQFLKKMAFSLLACLLAAGTLQAFELPGKTELNLKSTAEDIERFRDYSAGLSVSGWPELTALGDLTFAMLEALETGDTEGFVAARAVYHYRIEGFSDEIQTEILRLRLGVQCEGPRVIVKNDCDGDSGPTGCTSDPQCVIQCGGQLGAFCSSQGSCVCP